MKMCNKCSENKDITEFGNDKRNSDGRQGICNFSSGKFYPKQSSRGDQPRTSRSKKT